MRIEMISEAVVVMAIGSRALVLKERRRRGDEAHVGEGLREVAGRLSAARPDLLGEEPHVVRIAAKALEEPLRLVPVPGVREILRRPEIARREGVLRGGDAVVAGVVRIAMDEAVAIERLRDVAVGSLHARIARLAIAIAREEKEARV